MKKAIALCVLAIAILASVPAQAPVVPGLGSKKITINLWTHEDPNRSVIEKKYIAEFMGISAEWLSKLKRAQK